MPVTPLLSTAPKISAALLTNLYILWYPDAVNAQLRQQLCGTKCSYQLRGITLRWRPWRGVIWGACLRASPAPFSAGNRERRIYFARSMRVCNSVKIRRRKKRGNFLKFSPRFFKKFAGNFRKPRRADFLPDFGTALKSYGIRRTHDDVKKRRSQLFRQNDFPLFPAFHDKSDDKNTKVYYQNCLKSCGQKEGA